MTARGGFWIAATGVVAAAAALAGCSSGGANAGVGGASGSGGSAAGTGGNSSGAGGAMGTGGAAAGSGGFSGMDAAVDSGSSDAGGGEIGAHPCSVDLIPLSAPSFLDDIERGPAPFRVRAQVTPKSDTDQWAWTITYPNPDASVAQPIVVQTTAVNNDPAVVEFPLPVKARYSITARISNRAACPSITRNINVIDPRPAAFVVRVFPPASVAAPVQEFRMTREQLVAGVRLSPPLQVQTIKIFTYDNRAQPLPSYLQITSPGSSLVIEGNTQQSEVSEPLLRDHQYDLLIVPSGLLFAPKLISGVPDDLVGVLVSTQFKLDQGVPVDGQALRNDGSPVTGARLVLRQGTRPSTIGQSDSAGAFSLFTREGPLSVEIAAPLASGLPDAHVSAAPGIALGTSATGLSLTMRWAALSAGALAVTVHSADGATPLGGAAVHVELAAAIANAGQLTIHSPDAPAGAADVNLTATGSLHADAVADSKGAVTFPALPAGSYRITVTPPDAAGATAAITTTTVDVTAAGATRDVRIAGKVLLSGTLQAASGSSKGVRLSAIDIGTDVVTHAVSATVGDGGQYALSLDPGRTYKLWALPAAGQPFARTFLATKTAPPTSQTLSAFTLSVGMRADSSVTFSAAVADALVQVFCPPSSTTCTDTTLPIAEAVTDTTGAFSVVLPSSADPGAAAASGKI